MRKLTVILTAVTAMLSVEIKAADAFLLPTSSILWHNGNSFTYSESDPAYGGKTVLVKWASSRTGMRIIVK